ncbi:MAG: enoyl-CoA hydratase/isomerase family protein [Deltaproteobacteria bacterium]|nr:enoyl-CoA hydratase/isomerase family protein [Deltaproteobacteria bacterium]MBW2084858.1 enoyl-CoA hydratase/isomerase family protein [Deltaproteobacteria bacterium]
MAFEQILVEKKREHVTTVTLNRPNVMNAISPETSKELDTAFNEFADDPDAWICIVTGAGDRAFSAGNDLKYQATHSPEEMRKAMEGIKGGFGGVTSRWDCFKPFIAAVNGLALGGGFEVALACDIIIAADNATFGFPEHRVGLMPGAGGVHRLPRQMPYHIAMGLIMTSRRITAEEAMKWGVINEVVPQAELMSTVDKWIDEIMLGAPLSLRASKESTLKGLHMPLEEAMSMNYPGLQRMYGSEDVKEGPIAFVQKRPPQWKGR